MGKLAERITAEPVRFWATLTGLLTAVFGVIVAQGGMSDELVGGILVVWAAVGALFQFFYVRNKVSPTE